MLFLHLLVFFALVPSNVFASQLKINEFLANPTEDQKEWVEIYNPENLDIVNFYLKDKAGTKKTLESITNCSRYYIWELNTSSGEGWLNNSDKESIFLYDNSDNLIDSLEDWESPSEGKTLSRIPDETGSLVETEPTKCAQNEYKEPSPTPIPLSTPQSSSTSTPKKSPSPTPKPSSQKSPSPSPKVNDQPTSTPQVLGSTLQDSVSQMQNQPQNTPDTTAPIESTATKFAPYLIGSGLSIIGLSILIFYLYKRNLENKKISKGQERFEQDEQD